MPSWTLFNYRRLRQPVERTGGQLRGLCMHEAVFQMPDSLIVEENLRPIQPPSDRRLRARG